MKEKLTKLLLKHYKPGGLVFEIFPFNYYVKYIGKRIYKDTRRLGFPWYLSLYHAPLIFNILVNIFSIIQLDFFYSVVNIFLLNNIWFVILLNQHKKNIQRRVNFYSMKADYYKLRNIKFEIERSYPDVEKIPDSEKKLYEHTKYIMNEIKQTYTKYQFYTYEKNTTIRRRL